MSEISGANVLITGGASGIGRLMALKVARLGATVIVWDINQANLDATLEALQSASGRSHHGAICDVSNRADVNEQARRVIADVGGIDILINNAGVVSGQPLLEISDASIERSFGVNTLASFWTTRAFLPKMIEQNRGHVVTIASAAGMIGVSRLVDYSASKWAVVGFDESLRSELRTIAPAVQTTVVCPYYIDTGMFKGTKTRFSFLLPILKEDAVAERTVAAIRRNKRRVTMPWLVHWIPALRVLPVAFFDGVAGLLGINTSMDKFVGREDGKDKQ